MFKRKLKMRLTIIGTKLALKKNLLKCPSIPLKTFDQISCSELQLLQWEHVLFTHRWSCRSVTVCLWSACCLFVDVRADTHLIRLWAGQTARQRTTVAGQSGGEWWAAVCQDRFKVTERLLRRVTQRTQLLKGEYEQLFKSLIKGEILTG